MLSVTITDHRSPLTVSVADAATPAQAVIETTPSVLTAEISGGGAAAITISPEPGNAAAIAPDGGLWVSPAQTSSENW